eukprot:SAG31_NODE_145_length_22612_cov_5.938169_13_plen_57_part_00
MCIEDRFLFDALSLVIFKRCSRLGPSGLASTTLHRSSKKQLLMGQLLGVKASNVHS